METSGKDTDWFCLGHMSTSVPIIVAERMGTCNWLEMGHMFSLVAKAQGRLLSWASAQKLRVLGEHYLGSTTWSGAPPPSKEQDLRCYRFPKCNT